MGKKPCRVTIKRKDGFADIVDSHKKIAKNSEKLVEYAKNNPKDEGYQTEKMIERLKKENELLKMEIEDLKNELALLKETNKRKKK